MISVGRPKKPENAGLPPRMTPRRYPSGVVAYYYTSGRKKIPLGTDLGRAKLEWAKLENQTDLPGTFAAVVAEWRRTELGKRGVYTQKQYEKYFDELLPAFGYIPLGEICTVHCQQYLERRSAKIQANREISLLSSVFNWARRLGYTKTHNPVPGVRRNFEPSRKVYVTDEQFAEVYVRAMFWQQDAMDLALLTGQRPGDILSWTRQNIVKGCLDFRQAKTDTPMRIVIEGALKDVLERILARPRAVSSIYLIADEKGQRVTVDRLQKAHVKARGAMTWQFRDIRKKTGTDVDELDVARRLLGHINESTTARYYRQVKGDRVKPLR